MASDELAEHLNSLQRDDCYRVEKVLKENDHEVTEEVFFVGRNGAEQGPFVRKYIDSSIGLGLAYKEIFDTQRSGKRFRHLPHIYDYYNLGSKVAVIMEFVPGETLQDVVYRCDPSYGLACDLFPFLCDAVIELHEGFDAPVIHRDLKPSNIIVAKNSLTIIDFGIARLFKDGSEEDTNHFGTKSYAPPEQFGYGQTDERSDVYALGALLYFCLTERGLEYKAQKTGFKALAIPDGLRAVLVKATEFAPDDRYQSVQALKEAFLQATVGALAVTGAGKGEGVAVPMSYRHTSPDGQGAPSKPSRIIRALSGIPFEVGVVWDLILFLVLFLLIAASASLIIEPEPRSTLAGMPIVPRAIGVLCMSLLVFGAPLFLVSDRRPIRRLIPPFSKVPLKKDIFACVIAFVSGIMVIVALEVALIFLQGQ